MEDNRELRKNLDELIRLFRKLKDKERFRNMPGIDPLFFQNFELLVNNYEMIKNDLSDELINQFGAPIKNMIAETVNQLKEELGEKDYMELLADDTATEETVEPEEIRDDELINIQEEIERIDKRLKEPGISNTEIDKLLDKRSELQKRDSAS